MKNIGNKKLTKEEINKIAFNKMQVLLTHYKHYAPKILLEFHEEAKKIESWISDKLDKLGK